MEAVYYSAPVPRNLGVLAVMALVFDKVYFPGVHLPISGYDEVLLYTEIKRIEEALKGKRSRDDTLSVLRFLEHVPILQGFLEFTGTSQDIFGGAKDVSQEFVQGLYQAIHGPNPPGWTPMIHPGWHKGLPGGEESVDVPSQYYYMAKAVTTAADKGIPLLSDVPGLPIPMYEEQPKNPEMLSAILAIETVGMVLQDIPLLRPIDLMEFRAENKNELAAFRNEMKRYAKELNALIDGSDNIDDINAAAKKLAATEISHALRELNDKLEKGKSSWAKRAINGVMLAGEIGADSLVVDPKLALAKALLKYAPKLFQQWHSGREEKKVLERSGLYYLLKLQKFPGFD